MSMDQLSPRSLQDLCINILAEKRDILWRQKDGCRLFENGVEWRDPELFLHSHFADKLLEILSQKRTLRDGILSTLTSEHVCLENVKISFCLSDEEEGMQEMLSHHRLISLHIRHPLSMNICTLLKCIGNKSYESLQHLILQRQWRRGFWPHDDDHLAGQSVIETLLRFNCLKSVAISGIVFTDTMLTILGKSLLHVENLNLSGNYNITDISPLKNCQKTLKSLSLGGLPHMAAESAMAVFMTLTGLTYLDVSLETGIYMMPSEEYVGMFTADMLIQMPDILPNLVCLDLSMSRKGKSKRVRSEHALRQFLEAHQSLQMLVLWGSDACHFKSLQDFRPGLTVGGHATMEQYAAVLKHWTRTEEHQAWACFCHRRIAVIHNLSRDLQTKHFPPCNDDRLLQVLCIFPIHTGLLSDRNDCLQEGCFCLEAVSLLLEKGVITHLEPDTRQHLLLFCHRALQQPQWRDHALPDAHMFATKILKALAGEPQNPLWLRRESSDGGGECAKTVRSERLDSA